MAPLLMFVLHVARVLPSSHLTVIGTPASQPLLPPAVVTGVPGGPEVGLML